METTFISYLDNEVHLVLSCRVAHGSLPSYPPQIRTLAARAAASFVLSNEGNTPLLKHFSDLLPGILQVRPRRLRPSEPQSPFWCEV